MPTSTSSPTTRRSNTPASCSATRGPPALSLSRTMHDEMMAELRWSPAEVRTSKDGVDVNTLEWTASDRAAAQLLAEWPIAATIAEVGGGAGLEKGAARSVASASAVALLVWPSRGPRAWFDGGRALEKVWLRATELGLALQLAMDGAGTVSPRAARRGAGHAVAGGAEGAHGARRGGIDQLFDVPVGSSEIMLFRVARLPPPSARALRRDVDDVLSFGDEEREARKESGVMEDGEGRRCRAPGAGSVEGRVSMKVIGPFTSRLDPGPPMKTRGELRADAGGLLDGARYEFVFLTQTPDPASPGTTRYTGASTITLSSGEILRGADHGEMETDAATGAMRFLTIIELAGGTGPYAAARGRIAARGVIDGKTGEAVGHYEGDVER